MKMRKLLVTGALSLSLAFSSFLFPVYATSLSDTVGLSSEAAINKLVSLGVFPNTGENFNPEQTLKRADFAYIVKAVIGDAQSAEVAKGKGDVKFSELAKVLSRGLGLKSTWTDRPIDFLYYLDRKGVLDIDTDLDAVVTREDAAIAFDKYITLKNKFKSDAGVITQLNEDSIVLDNGIGTTSYKFAKNVSVFVSGQGVETQSLSVAMPVNLIFNPKGEIAFIEGNLLDAEEGTIAFKDGKLLINDKIVKDINPNAIFVPLPTSPNDTFTAALFMQYAAAGAQFIGQVLFPDTNDVTLATLYIAKAENKSLTFQGNKIEIEFTKVLKQSFEISPEVKVTLDEKEVKLEELKSLDKSKYTATIEANANGEIVSITAVSNK